jgi:arginine deiminase
VIVARPRENVRICTGIPSSPSATTWSPFTSPGEQDCAYTFSQEDGGELHVTKKKTLFEVVAGLGLKQLRVVTTGGDSEAEQEQWEDAITWLPWNPGVVVTMVATTMQYETTQSGHRSGHD